LAYLQKAKQEGLLAHVTEVTTDMWDAYVTAAREAFGEQVIVTIDRFHVMNPHYSQTSARSREGEFGWTSFE
jgi:transposase